MAKAVNCFGGAFMPVKKKSWPQPMNNPIAVDSQQTSR
jgi:hypothetical protein